MRGTKHCRTGGLKVLSFLLLAAVLIQGCSTSGPEQTRLMREHTDLDISAEELRIRVRSLVLPFSGIIEEAADEVAGISPDPAYRMAALRIKTNAIPAIHSTLLDPDPLVALMDTWALVAQMRLSLEAERELVVPEDVNRAMSRGLDRMEERITELVKSVTKPGGYEKARGTVYEWATQNPVDMSETTLMTRQSAAVTLATYSAVAKPGLRDASGGLSLGMGDVWARLDVYSAFLPKQARWQAELMVAELMAGQDPASAFDDFSKITDSIDRIADIVETAPDIVSAERETVLAALKVEREIALRTFHDELVAAYEFISRERIAAFTVGIASEREAALEALTRERIATLEELEAIVGGLSEDALTRLVDRIFIRLALLLAIALALAAVAGFIISRRPSR